MTIKILDCTLRDGGYYNNWFFSSSLVRNYLRAMEACSVDYIELGFRFISIDESRGPFGKTSDEFLKTLDLPPSLKYGVMVNGSDYLFRSEKDTTSAINNNFAHCKDSPISLVRVAINFNKALEVQPLIQSLKNLGYEVGLNLMQASGKTEADYINTAIEINNWNLVDILYFADSFGNMDPESIDYIIENLKKGWPGTLGFHSHNNKGFALINSLKAIDQGVVFCDSTVTGMGRGAGNVATESLLMELVNMGLVKKNLSLIQGTVSDFTKLKSIYGWGTNMHYQYAANNNIHPTFVQTLLEDSRYDHYQSFKILESLSEEDNSSRFSSDSLKSIIYKADDRKEGSWSPEGFLEGEEVILVGGGKSVLEYKKSILDFIENKDIKVIFLNINNFLPQEIGIATIVSHEIRAFLDATFYSNLLHPLIIPMKSLGKLVKKYIQKITIYDYGLNLKEGSMKIDETSCELHNTLVAGYALAVCTRAGAKKINLVGFDGYQVDDIRYQEMSELLERYSKLEESVEVVSLTPTTYNLELELLDV